MGFWKLDDPPESVAVVDVHAGSEKSYGELREDVARAASAMREADRKALIMLAAKNRYNSLVLYLAALNSGQALMMVDPNLGRDLLLPLLETYRPDYVYGDFTVDSVAGYRKVAQSISGCWVRETRDNTPIHPSLALLLNTSGSTGSPKLVRLTRENLQANARSISTYLKLTPSERAITSLPMSYSYGLSVVNSHLLARASLVLSDHGILRSEFWDAVDRFRCTSMAGVPYTYQMVLQTGLLEKRGSTLRTLTQAGGGLGEPLIRKMHELALRLGFRFFVMYGQTEATARISYVPAERLGEKIGSIGIAIPGGSMEVDSGTGELVYTGPNVMLGYAECREDLAKGDDLQGVLRTGDLARKDQDDFFYITGRLKRFLKLFGKRFSLDEMEQIVHRNFGAPVACFGDDDLLMMAIETQHLDPAQIAAMVCSTFSLPRPAVQVRTMAQLPRTERGKLDYAALARINEGTAPGGKSAVQFAERTVSS
jgi:acyl-CoA synthetase (AMP-forming)/AMP-acid ligase II